jgi:hypothetical protein
MTVFDSELPESTNKQPRIVPVPHDFLKQRKAKPPGAQTVRGAERQWIHRQGIGYQLRIADLNIQLDLTRLHTSKDDISGLLTVRVKIAGARTVGDDILSSADFNVSSLRARTERAKHLQERARVEEIDWLGILEELCLRVLTQEEVGQPEIALCDIPAPTDQVSEIDAAGMPLLRRHPVIWFGDGAAGKSLLALYAAIDLAQSGYRVLYCDWEFSGEEHAERMRRFIGSAPAHRDSLFYRRCDRPFIREVTQIREIISRRQINFLICDSIGFAVQTAPENAEDATGYFRALRECGPIGSLHLAHMNRSEQGDKKPFGSIFWHNGARATWYLKRTGAEADNSMTVGFFHRKSNIGRLRPDLGQRVDFSQTATSVAPCDINEAPELAQDAQMWQRIDGVLRNHSDLTIGQIAEELDEKAETVRKTLYRYEKKQHFKSLMGSDGVKRFKVVTPLDRRD